MLPPTDCKDEEVCAGAMCQYGAFSPEGLQGREGEESDCFLLNLPETLQTSGCAFTVSTDQSSDVGVCWPSPLAFLHCPSSCGTGTWMLLSLLTFWARAVRKHKAVLLILVGLCTEVLKNLLRPFTSTISGFYSYFMCTAVL